MSLAPVAGDGIKEEEPGIYLVLLQFISPDTGIAGNHHRHHACGAVTLCKVVPEKPRMAAAPRGRELYLRDEPVPGSIRTDAHLHAGGDYKAAVNLDSIAQGSRKRRKLHEGLRLRKVLPPQRCKSVIGRYEKVLAGDIGLVVEGRPVRLHVPGQLVPDLLRLVGNLPPCDQRPAMDTEDRQLAFDDGPTCACGA